MIQQGRFIDLEAEKSPTRRNRRARQKARRAKEMDDFAAKLEAYHQELDQEWREEALMELPFSIFTRDEDAVIDAAAAVPLMIQESELSQMAPVPSTTVPIEGALAECAAPSSTIPSSAASLGAAGGADIPAAALPWQPQAPPHLPTLLPLPPAVPSEDRREKKEDPLHPPPPSVLPPEEETLLQM